MKRYRSYRREYRSDAWYMDGGANDEGYENKYCHYCAKKTEHEQNDCIPCSDRARNQSSWWAKKGTK